MPCIVRRLGFEGVASLRSSGLGCGGLELGVEGGPRTPRVSGGSVVVVSGVVVEGVVVEGMLHGGPPDQHECVECGETQWSFGGPNDSLIRGLVWSCGGCSAFLPYLPPKCSLTVEARESMIRSTPMYCGDACQIEHWFREHHKFCRRHDVAMCGYVHHVTSSLHGVVPVPFGRRVERGGVVTHIPYLTRSIDKFHDGARYV